ncbi:hypothetical protein Tco_0875848 [Tanacetum coccineum]|uniref:Uncharacterized protein n=1 Tax=Tanacetum coccineum TaxID=301880 RepID=A0ABQ5BTJ0_9ASTR
MPSIKKPINMYCDNSAAIIFANDSGVMKGARHFLQRYHYVREQVESGEIKILKVHTDDNLADPFTKALPRGKVTDLANGIGLQLCIPVINIAAPKITIPLEFSPDNRHSTKFLLDLGNLIIRTQLNHLEKNDSLWCCPTSDGKQFWLSIVADASVLQSELNSPVYDWKISVNAPLKLENRKLFGRGDFLLGGLSCMCLDAPDSRAFKQSFRSCPSSFRIMASSLGNTGIYSDDSSWQQPFEFLEMLAEVSFCGDSPILAAGVDLHESTTYLATGVDLDESTNEVHKLIKSTTEVVIVDHVFKEESTEVVQAPEVFDVEDDFD